MVRAKQVAEYILAISNPESGDLISNLKLQKLVYYTQGIHLAMYGMPIFEEEIKAWAYGPVVESLYNEYKTNGAGAILPLAGFDFGLTKMEKKFIGTVFQYYAQYSASKLMQMTHEEAPWKNTARGGVISKELLSEFFQTQSSFEVIKGASREDRLRNAALFLLADYENNEELTSFTSIDNDEFL